MWTNKNRARYDRGKLRYPSDLTDAEWGLVEPLIPPGKTGGRLAKDWENLNRKALAFLRLASIRLMLRKLCNPA